MNNAAGKPIKVYVAVKADFAENGKMIPRQITWEDGSKYEIDRILDVRQATAMKAGVKIAKPVKQNTVFILFFCYEILSHHW